MSSLEFFAKAKGRKTFKEYERLLKDMVLPA
jgi:hypothetical protein